MTITDYSCCDFIEIFNNPEPLHEVNEKGVKLWENLVLSGEKLAATCGMDLHGNSTLHGHYSTYIQGEPDGDICRELSDAIHNQRTWICKGPLLEVHNDGEALTSPSTRPENRATTRSPKPTTRSPSAPGIRSSPATSPTGSRWLLLQSMQLLFRCFSKKKPSSKTSYAQAR